MYNYIHAETQVAQVLESDPDRSSPPSLNFRIDLYSRLIFAFTLRRTLDFTVDSILTSALTFTGAIVLASQFTFRFRLQACGVHYTSFQTWNRKRA